MQFKFLMYFYAPVQHFELPCVPMVPYKWICLDSHLGQKGESEACRQQWLVAFHTTEEFSGNYITFKCCFLYIRNREPLTEEILYNFPHHTIQEDGCPALCAKLFDGQITWRPQLFVERMQSGFNLWLLPVANCNLVTSCFVIFLLLPLSPCFAAERPKWETFPRWWQENMLCVFYSSATDRECELLRVCECNTATLFKLQTFFFSPVSVLFFHF